MKILHLVLYSNTNDYIKMYKLTRKYYKKFNNVITIYYRFCNKITDNYFLKRDILLIKGEETYVPGILDKTIKALSYFSSHDYQYIVRSNISTIVNFTLLNNYLNKNTINYAGGFLNNLQWIDHAGGIKDNTFFGTIYASGTCILFNKDTFNYLINNIHNINYDILDDVSIGLLLKDIPKTDIGHFYFVPEINDNYEYIKNNKNNIIFYRNRNSTRDIDVKQMKEIINLLI